MRRKSSRCRGYKVNATLVVVDLVKHDKSILPNVVEMTEKAIADVKGLDNENELLGAILYHRINALLTLNKTAEAMDALGQFIKHYPADKAMTVIQRTIAALYKEFETARDRKDDARAKTLAANISTVADYLVQAAEKSGDTKLLQFREFQRHAERIAADLEEDDAKKQPHYQRA